MPRFEESDGMEMHTIGGSNFGFSAARIDGLGSTEYTLVSILVDQSSSVREFAKELRDAVLLALDACKKSPRADNLMVRIALFSSVYSGGIQELIGFTPLSQIDPSSIPDFRPNGATPLFDAVYSGVGATIAYGEKLMASDFLANGIVFIVTDGAQWPENDFTMSPKKTKDMVAKANKSEALESLVTVLVGINTDNCTAELEKLRDEAGIDQYTPVGEATKGRLAKFANFVSHSVSSTSQALGTGGPSQNISATI